MTTLSNDDRKLLGLLSADARASTAALARMLGVSRSTIQSRLARLERLGVIKGYTVVLAEDYLDRLLKAHVMIALDPKRVRDVEKALEAMKGVQALYSVSGAHDLAALVGEETPQALDALLDEIRDVPGVVSTTTSVILSTRFVRPQ